MPEGRGAVRRHRVNAHSNAPRMNRPYPASRPNNVLPFSPSPSRVVTPRPRSLPLACATAMNHPEQILRTLDSHLVQPTRLILYGRAALALGYPDPPLAFHATMDVDAILPEMEMSSIESDNSFWAIGNRKRNPLIPCSGRLASRKSPRSKKHTPKIPPGSQISFQRNLRTLPWSFITAHCRPPIDMMDSHDNFHP